MQHYVQHRDGPAEKNLRAALVISPDSCEIVNTLADIVLHFDRNPAAAEALFRRAVQLSPNYGLYRANLAACLVHEGRRAEAIVEARKAIQLGCTDHPVLKELGLA